MIQRRNFIKNAGIALIGTGLINHQPFKFPTSSTIKIGIQLYTVRDVIFKNPVDILQKLAKMGYQNIEHADYVNRKLYGYAVPKFKKIIDDNGLSMISGHTVLQSNHYKKESKTFTDSWKYTIEDAALLGQQYVISPWMDEKIRKDYDKLMAQLDIFNKCGELCNQFNLKFGYHNHNFEFKDKLNNQFIYDIILKNTDPKLVIQQLDIGNLYGVGGRAMDVIKQNPNRFPSLHVKDEIKATVGEMNDGYDSTLLGNGEVKPFEICTLAKEIGGTTHFIVEQESYQGLSSMECAKINLDRLKSINL